MKLYKILIILTLCLYNSNHAFSENKSVKWIEDIPIQEDFIIEKDLGFTYDTAEKRIIVFYGYTKKSDEEILNFYDENLKQLGWNGKLGKYKRNSEIMEIKKLQIKNVDIWKITLE